MDRHVQNDLPAAPPRRLWSLIAPTLGASSLAALLALAGLALPTGGPASRGALLGSAALAALGAGLAAWRGRQVLGEIAADEAELRLREERYQLALAGSNDGLWDWDIQTDRVYFSTRVLEILGGELPRDNLRFPDFVEFLHPEDKPRILEALRAHLCDQVPYDVQCRSRTLAGDYLWLRIRGQSVRDDQGKATRMAGSITDITEHRRTAQRWQFALEEVGEGVWEWDATVNRVSYSPRWMESMGYAADQASLFGAGVRDWLHPDDDALQWTRLQQHLEGKVPVYNSVHRLRSRDGSYKWVVDRGKVIEWSDDHKPLRMIGGHTDITQLKRAEEALARSNSQLRALFDAATHVAIIATDRAGKISVFNKGAERLLGYTAAEVIGLKTPAFLHLQEELDARAAELEGLRITPEMDDAATLAQLQHWQAEDRFWTYVCKDGSHRIVHLIITPVCETGAEITGFLGVAIDMTARRRAELARRDSEAMLRALFERSPLGMTLAQRNGRYVDSNRAFQQMVGYTSDELAAMSPDSLFTPEYRIRHAASTLQLLMQDSFGPIEFELVRKDGSEVPVSVNGTALRLNDEEYVWTIVEDITQRRAAEREIEQLAFFDPLTGLPNRRLFMDRLQLSLLRARRERRFGALMFLDLDQFKRINDAHDHVTGDHLLQMIGPRLGDVLREQDTVARLGGDEFVLLLEGIGATLEEATRNAQMLAEQLRTALRLPFYFAAIQHKVSASIGVTLFPKSDETVDDLMRQADTAMYHVKDRGRDGICFFMPEMQELALGRLALERDLQQALGGEQLRLFLQPQVDQHGRIVGAEALLRWQHPRQGLLAPAKFIPIAEESGLIVPLGEWVLRETGRLLRRLRRPLAEFSISVNISPRQFRESNFVERVRAVVGESGCDPRQLVLEITEGILVSDIDEAIAKMTALREFGVRWSLDDFGTGYSSLAYLKRLPLQELKIDRSFVKDLDTDSNDAAIVETILSMARHLGLVAVAEGVESPEQFDFLKLNGCPFFQGYLFGKPRDMLELFPLPATAVASPAQ